MAAPDARSSSERNLLLRALPTDVYQRVAPYLESVILEAGVQIYDRGEVVEFVHFPDNSLISFVTAMQDGTSIELGIVGNDGMSALGILLGGNLGLARAIVQIGGGARRIRLTTLTGLIAELSELRELLQRYGQTFFTHTAQSAACNAKHTVEQRCARWLLLTHDRMDGDEFKLTQEFMATMLGVRRAGVSVAAGALQRANIIRYSRGLIIILDRPALEAASCECYQIVANEYDRMMGAEVALGA